MKFSSKASCLLLAVLFLNAFVSTSAIRQNVLNDQIKKALANAGPKTFDFEHHLKSPFRTWQLKTSTGVVENYNFDEAVFSMTDDQRVLVEGIGFRGGLTIHYDEIHCWVGGWHCSTTSGQNLTQSIHKVSFMFKIHLEDKLTFEDVKIDLGQLKLDVTNHKFLAYFASEAEKLLSPVVEFALELALEIGSKKINLDSVLHDLLHGQAVHLPQTAGTNWVKSDGFNLNNFAFSGVKFNVVKKDQVQIQVSGVGFSFEDQVTAWKWPIINVWHNTNRVTNLTMQGLDVTLAFRLYENPTGHMFMANAKDWSIDIADVDLDFAKKSFVGDLKLFAGEFCQEHGNWCLQPFKKKVLNWLLDNFDGFLSEMIEKIAKSIVNTKNLKVTGHNLKN
eukprot:Nk52_evm15s1916 gene=Nk52_evmTU15s1916